MSKQDIMLAELAAKVVPLATSEQVGSMFCVTLFKRCKSMKPCIRCKKPTYVAYHVMDAVYPMCEECEVHAVKAMLLYLVADKEEVEKSVRKLAAFKGVADPFPHVDIGEVVDCTDVPGPILSPIRCDWVDGAKQLFGKTGEELEEIKRGGKSMPKYVEKALGKKGFKD